MQASLPPWPTDHSVRVDRVLVSPNKLFELVQGSKLLKQNLIFFIGTTATASINYLFYPVMGRLLPPNEFGEVQVVLALSMQIAAIFSIVRLIVVREVANADAETSVALTNRIQHFMIQASIAVAAVGLAASPFLARSLQYRSVVPMLLLVVILVLAIIRSPIDGFLRGRQLFTQSAIADLTASVLKLVLAAMLAFIGLSVHGVLTAVIFAMAGSYVFELICARRAGLRKTANKAKEHLSLPVIKFAVRSLASVGLASMAITILIGLDTVMAKRFFDPETAGLYSGISIISNILFYATISVTGVLFSTVKRRQSQAANRRILFISLALLGVVGSVGMVIFAIWPDFIIKLLLGERYLPLAHVLPYAGGSMLALSCTNLLIMYCIALDVKRVGLVSLLGTSIVVICVIVNHGSIEKLAASFCIGNLLMLIICLVWMVSRHRRQERQVPA